MAESGLSLQLSDLAAATGNYLGYTRTTTKWSGWQAATPYVPSSLDTQLGHIMDCVQSGYRSFLFPILSDEGPTIYEWSFLTPRRTLQVVSGAGVYDLPDDYRDLVGDLTFQPTDSTWQVVKERGIGDVDRALMQLQGATAKPAICAIYPKQTDGTQGQRMQISFAPLPDNTYTLTYRSSLLPQPLSSLNPFPYGGMQHGETILESCLAVAEARYNEDPQTTHRDLFKERLRASVALDREMRPAYLGYNADRSDQMEQGYDAWSTGVPYGTQTVGVTYNGAPF